MNINELDMQDKKILNIIRNSARLSYSQIGEAVGLSRVAVKNRILGMEKVGIIKGYQTIIDEAANRNSLVEFALDINVNSEHFREVADGLIAESFIRKLCVMTGRCKLMACGYAPNTQILSSYVEKLYNNMHGIEAISWQIVLSTLKDVEGGIEYGQRDEL